MKFKIDAQVEIRDKNGKLIRKFSKPCNSYLRSIIDMLYLHMVQGTATVKDTTGTNRTISPTQWTFRANGLATITILGIQVGTGTDAVTISDHKLQTLIAHGNSATQLYYGATSITSTAIVGSTAKFTIARTFTNNSGADISPKEVALGCIAYEGANAYYFIVERTLLDFTIANGQSGTVTYTISVTA